LGWAVGPPPQTRPPGAAVPALPLLEPAVRRAILEEVSGDAAYEHIRYMSRYHRPRGGADGLWLVAEYVAERARAYGLEDVQLIRQRAPNRPWNARLGELWIVDAGGRPAVRVASTLQTPLHLADHSRPAELTAELVDAGAGTARELDAAAVRGRVVLSYGPAAVVLREAVARGAVGLVWYPSPFSLGSGIDGGGPTRLDQVRWVTLPLPGATSPEPTFAFVLSLRQGLELRERLLGAGGALRVRATVDAAFDSELGAEPWQVMVEGWIRGAEPARAQDVIFVAHMQEEATSANDDASGVAGTLELARALGRLIGDGRLPRPRRDLRFWWVTEFGSQRQYFADHPAAHRRMWVAINQDMTGADQSQDILRKQNVTRLPATRFHLLNDVMETVVAWLVAANTFELAQLQAGIPLYPEPHVAQLGSRHRYAAEAIFFHGNTDHVPFLEAPIGVPAVSFTNMPDRFIHSSDDDLWNIDRTQLGRNAAAAGLIGWIMATADAAALPALAAEVAGRGAERQARNLRLGLGWIAAGGTGGGEGAGAGERATAYHAAADQVRYAAARERRAVHSLEEVDGAAAAHVAPLLEAIGRREVTALAELEGAYRRLAGGAPPARVENEAERRLAALRPAVVAGPERFLAARGRVATAAGLHGIMAFEVLNAVDGRRTGLEIHRLVAAQAREAGAHYYGVVRAEAVLEQLANLEAQGLVRTGAAPAGGGPR
jgi:hypothetical protein